MASSSSCSNNITTAPPLFEPLADWTLMSQGGAEARLFRMPNCTAAASPAAIAKQRFSKACRHIALDERLIKQRTKSEAKCLVKC